MTEPQEPEVKEQDELFEIVVTVQSVSVKARWGTRSVYTEPLGDVLVVFEIPKERDGQVMWTEWEGRKTLTVAGLRRYVEMTNAVVILDADQTGSVEGDF